MALDGNVKTWDGSQWVQTQAGSDIPDSAVRQWPFAQRSNSTIVENLADDDGTVSGSPTNTADSSFYDGYYEATDGNDDAILLPISEWQNQIQSGSWGFAFTLRTSSIPNMLLGTYDGTEDQFFIRDSDGDGKITFRIDVGGDKSSIESSTAVDNSTIRRVFVDVPDNNPSNWEIYLNDSADNATEISDGNISQSIWTANQDVAFGARNTSSGLDRFTSADFDHPILYDGPSRQDITDDYQLQPFA
jgi:hypothetical protein